MLASPPELHFTRFCISPVREDIYLNRIGAPSLKVLAVGLTLFLSACGSTGNSALNLAGTWTITTVSTQGHKGASGSLVVSQTGQGLGVNGSTALGGTVGQIALGQISLTQTGTALTGAVANSAQKVVYNFTGTLSGSNLTLSGSASCGSGVNSTQSTGIVGTITSNAASGTYTVSSASACHANGDAGTFTATKQ
jgi:hypothetical protein